MTTIDQEESLLVHLKIATSLEDVAEDLFTYGESSLLHVFDEEDCEVRQAWVVLIVDVVPYFDDKELEPNLVDGLQEVLSPIVY